MATSKKLTDLIDYTQVLPYASEMFGIYQPLIGWKSKRIERRFNRGFRNDKRSLLNLLLVRFRGLLDVEYAEECIVKISLKPGEIREGNLKAFKSLVLQKIAAKLPSYEKRDGVIWPEFINQKSISNILQEHVTAKYSDDYTEYCRKNVKKIQAQGRQTVLHDSFLKNFEAGLQYESSVAGALLWLTEQKHFDVLYTIFYINKNKLSQASELANIISALDPIDGYLNLTNMDPQDQEHLKRVALSPISVVHLFRQYFFELDSFLGPPVSHVWLSPGSTVELIEIQTRKTIVEKTVETSLEKTVKTETEITEQDEISDAVKEDNKQEIKFGAGVTASYASVTATSSFDLNNSQEKSREETHKRMRQQTEKLSTEIRKNFKSTFKTITETTDTSSKRYVLNNTTDELINYELRRKMRQVAVQVQDVGTYLCWQAYVDNPGSQLGIGKLLHFAKAPEDVEGPPEAPTKPEPFEMSMPIGIPFVPATEDALLEDDDAYRDGVEVETDASEGEVEKIQADFGLDDPFIIICNKPAYLYGDLWFEYGANDVLVTATNVDTQTPGTVKFGIHVNHIHFHGQQSVVITAKIKWLPDEQTVAQVEQEYQKKIDQYSEKTKYEFEKAQVETARERINLASKIELRKSEELREEERIVVYRCLIQEMLTHGITMPDNYTRHVVAELINSIFDVDKMLYFVVPEWWRPRYFSYKQQGIKQSMTASQLLKSSVAWGDILSFDRDNYYITEDSVPARFGSSLGWLLQLDGDNMRNAFLNAPWVKAVIPIRPGKEEAAINWLKGVEGFNGIGDNDFYQTNNPNEKDINGNPLNGQKLIDVIIDLAKKIQKKHQEGIETGLYPKQDEIADPALVDFANVVTSTPIDRVYEHGFYPLQGGFRANVQKNYEIFDQWLEILPTDQVVPVEVKYDPKTGRQV